MNIIEAWELNHNTQYPELNHAFVSVPGITQDLGNDYVLKPILFTKLISEQQPTEYPDLIKSVQNLEVAHSPLDIESRNGQLHKLEEECRAIKASEKSCDDLSQTTGCNRKKVTL